MIRKTASILATVGLLLAGCNLRLVARGSAQAWIDAPLDGMKLPLAPYTIVFHASDPLHVQRMEVSINGQVLATLPNPDPTQGLVHLTQVWQPQQTGRYVIGVRAQNGAGIWTDRDIVTVVVESATATIPPTTTPTLTLIPPTATPTSTLTPTNTPVRPFFTFQATPKAVYYRGTGCGDMRVQFQVQVADPVNVAGVWLFVRLAQKGGAETTTWSEALVMDPAGAGRYVYSLPTESIPDFSKFADAWVQYQFVAYDKNFSRLANSNVFGDVELAICNH